MRPLRWGADASEDSGDDLISQGEQGSDGARGREQEVWALLTRYQLAPSPTGWPTGSRPASPAWRLCQPARREASTDLFADEHYRRGETDIPSYEAYNPFRHQRQGPYA